MNPEELQRAAVNTLYRRIAVSHLVLTFAGTTLAHRFALRRCGTETDVIYHSHGSYPKWAASIAVHPE